MGVTNAQSVVSLCTDPCHLGFDILYVQGSCHRPPCPWQANGLEVIFPAYRTTLDDRELLFVLCTWSPIANSLTSRKARTHYLQVTYAYMQYERNTPMAHT